MKQVSLTRQSITAGLMLAMFIILAACGYLPALVQSWPDVHLILGGAEDQATFLRQIADTTIVLAIGFVCPAMLTVGARHGFRG